jgi:hypothetical protein
MRLPPVRQPQPPPAGTDRGHGSGLRELRRRRPGWRQEREVPVKTAGRATLGTVRHHITAVPVLAAA